MAVPARSGVTCRADAASRLTEPSAPHRGWDDPRVTAYLSALAVCATSITVGAALCCRTLEWSWIAAARRARGRDPAARPRGRAPAGSRDDGGRGGGDRGDLPPALVVARRRVAPRPARGGRSGGRRRSGRAVRCRSSPTTESASWAPGSTADLAVHMAQADALRTHGSAAHITPSGYPNGPHAVVAALDARAGRGAVGRLHGPSARHAGAHGADRAGRARAARWYLRMPAAVLTGIPYLAASYFAQGSFKEPLLALLFLGFVLALREAHGSRPARVRARARASPDRGGGGRRLRDCRAGVARGAPLLWLGALELVHGWRPNLGRWRRAALAPLAGLCSRRRGRGGADRSARVTSSTPAPVAT